MTNPPSPFGLPRRDSDGPKWSDGYEDESSLDHGVTPDSGRRDLGGRDPNEELTLSIRGVRAKPGEEPGEIDLEIETTRGVIVSHFTPVEGKTGVAIFIGGAGGGTRGPANEMYLTLAAELALAGVSTLRPEYRKPADFEECVMDVLACCSFLKGIGAERAVVVGHSFGGAVAIKVGELAPLISAVCQRLLECGHQDSYLRTISVRITAIRLYLGFGFLPDVRSPHDAEIWQGICKHIPDLALLDPWR